MCDKLFALQDLKPEYCSQQCRNQVNAYKSSSKTIKIGEDGTVMDKKVDDLIDDICTKKIESRKINEQPLCVLLGGLPGSGKTNLVRCIQEKYKNRDFVVIDTDDYRKLHPDYENLVKTPERAIKETSDFSNTIESELIKRAIERKCDIISVTTLRATETIDKILYMPAVKKGYKIEVCIMSVPICESGLSAQTRYEKQISNGECPRFTPMNFIETSYRGIINTIQVFQNKDDNKPIIKVYNRGKGENSMPREVYSSIKQTGRYSCALEAFMNPIRVIDDQIAIEQIKHLYRLKKSRNASEVEYCSLKRLEELFDIIKDIER